MLRVTGVSSGSSSARLLSVPCWALYQFPPLSSSAAGMLLRVSNIFVAFGAKTEAARGGFTRSGALGLPGAGHGLAACPGVSSRRSLGEDGRFIEA